MSGHGPALRLDGRTYAITGSSRGIGAAVAEDLAARGADVVLNGRDAEALERQVADLAGRSAGRITGVPGPAYETAVAEDMLAAASAGDARVAGLITCAGVAEPPGSSILTVSPEELSGLMDAHLGTAFAPRRVFAPPLAAHGGGRVGTTRRGASGGGYGGVRAAVEEGAAAPLALGGGVRQAGLGRGENGEGAAAGRGLIAGEDEGRRLGEREGPGT